MAKTARLVVAAAVRTTFQQADRAAAQTQLKTVCAALAPRFPSVVVLLTAAEEEVLTFADFSAEHWRQIWSTNPFERLTVVLLHHLTGHNHREGGEALPPPLFIRAGAPWRIDHSCAGP